MRGISSKYLLGRLLRFALTVWLGATLIFVIPRLGPSDPTDAILGRLAASGASVDNAQALIDSYRDRFGLDESPSSQYLHYLANTFTLRNGYSLSQFPATVDDLVWAALPWTIGLILVSTLVSFILGTLIGALLGWPGTPRIVRRTLPLTLVFTSLPAFMLGILLVYVFAYRLAWFPYSGAYSADVSPAFTLDFLGSAAYHAVLPAASVVLVTMGAWALGMRGMMVTTAGEDYMVLARAKGLRPRRIFLQYGIRNAILPQITALGLALGTIAGGFVVVETVFAYPGLGSLLYRAILDNDYTVIQGVTFYLVLGVALAVLILDLVYPLLDPRISYERR
ncbi:MAG: ABC transporter permease [Gaiellales bacterium]